MLSNINKVFFGTNRVKMQTEILTRSKSAKFSTDGLKVEHDSSKNKFYIEMNNSKAFVDYQINDNKNTINFLHTEVPEIFRGKGVAKILAQEVLIYAEKNNIKAQIDCEFLKSYYNINKHKYKALRVL